MKGAAMSTGVSGSLRSPARRSMFAWFAVAALAALAFAELSALSTSAEPASAEPASAEPASAQPASAEPAATRPETRVRRLSCEPLADVPGKSVTTALVVFPPRAYTPAHRHPGSVTAYVVSGSIRSQMDALPAATYAAGSTWFEPAGALHRFAENQSASETAELLALFIADSDCSELVIPEPRGSHHDGG
jgi:quercetin dioxygenase-like cupin family protein